MPGEAKDATVDVKAEEVGALYERPVPCLCLSGLASSAPLHSAHTSPATSAPQPLAQAKGKEDPVKAVQKAIQASRGEFGDEERKVSQRGVRHGTGEMRGEEMR